MGFPLFGQEPSKAHGIFNPKYFKIILVSYGLVMKHLKNVPKSQQLWSKRERDVHVNAELHA
jgi:hypothetical protein